MEVGRIICAATQKSQFDQGSPLVLVDVEVELELELEEEQLDWVMGRSR